MLTSLYNSASRYALIGTVAVILLNMVLFFPPGYASIDEHDYLRNAVQLAEGNLRQACDPKVNSQFPVRTSESSYCISKYNLGASVFFLPVVQQPQLAFAITTAVLIAGCVIFAALLRMWDLSPLWVAAYGFYPAFTYFSRTLFSETFSATLVTLSFYLLVRYVRSYKWYWGVMAGLSIGAAVFVRYTNILALGTLLLLMTTLPAATLGEFIRYNIALTAHTIVGKFGKAIQAIWVQITHAFWPLVGGIPMAILWMTLNNYLYGSPFRSGYYYSGEEGVFLFLQVPLFLGRFITILTALYPLMFFVVIFLAKRYRLAIGAAIWLHMLFYATFPSTFFEGRVEDLIFGARFLVPIVPILLVMYVDRLNGLLVRYKWMKAVALLAMVILAVTSTLISSRHQQFLSTASYQWPESPPGTTTYLKSPQ